MNHVWHTVLVFPASDLPGVWIAQALDLDVITQGDGSAQAAIEMLADALALVHSDCMKRKFDLAGYPLAPSEDWDRYAEVLKRGAMLDLDTAMRLRGGVVRAAGSLALDVGGACWVRGQLWLERREPSVRLVS